MQHILSPTERVIDKNKFYIRIFPYFISYECHKDHDDRINFLFKAFFALYTIFSSNLCGCTCWISLNWNIIVTP